ncbi:hypothetical protein G9A89_019070 [Geosiphon pyriformis]|nr:hypothetical protein G9A89_019070 [Geosiphon pyriformis]
MGYTASDVLNWGYSICLSLMIYVFVVVLLPYKHKHFQQHRTKDPDTMDFWNYVQEREEIKRKEGEIELASIDAACGVMMNIGGALITTKDSVQTPNEGVTEDLNEGEDITAIVFGRGDEPKWFLADNTDIGVMFEKLIKTSLICNDICKAFGGLELCAACDEKRDRHAPSDKALAYLNILMTSNIKDARRAVLEPICSEYNIKEHYDLNYVQTVLTLFEFTNNPLLDQHNSEGFFQVHVFGLFIDQLFFDVTALQVVRGEVASRAVSFRKNMSCKVGRGSTHPRYMASSLNDSLKGQSKFLSDRRKLARGFKDQLDLVYAFLPEDQKSVIVPIIDPGILHFHTRVYNKGVFYAVNYGIYRGLWSPDVGSRVQGVCHGPAVLWPLPVCRGFPRRAASAIQFVRVVAQAPCALSGIEALDSFYLVYDVTRPISNVFRLSDYAGTYQDVNGTPNVVKKSDLVAATANDKTSSEFHSDSADNVGGKFGRRA